MQCGAVENFFMGGWEGGVKPRRLTCYPAPAPILLLLVRVLLKITVQCYYKLSILLHKVVFYVKCQAL